MKASSKALLWIVLTYASGIASGMVLNGALANRRNRVPMNANAPAAGPPGFVEQMQRQLEVRDSAQAQQLRPYLEEADARNRGIVDGARGAMGSVMDSLRIAVAPLLDSAQRERMANIGRPPQGRMGGRGVPPEGGRPPGLEMGGERGGPPGGERGVPSGHGRPGGPPALPPR